jgi:hypothetical protein
VKGEQPTYVRNQRSSRFERAGQRYEREEERNVGDS